MCVSTPTCVPLGSKRTCVISASPHWTHGALGAGRAEPEGARGRSTAPRSGGSRWTRGAGRGKMTVAGLAEQLGVAMGRLATPEERLSQLQPSGGDGLDAEEEFEGSIAFGGAKPHALA